MAMAAQMMQVVYIPLSQSLKISVIAIGGMMVTSERIGKKYRRAMTMDINVIPFQLIFFSVSFCMVFFCKDSLFFEISKAEDVLSSA